MISSYNMTQFQRKPMFGKRTRSAIMLIGLVVVLYILTVLVLASGAYAEGCQQIQIMQPNGTFKNFMYCCFGGFCSVYPL